MEGLQGNLERVTDVHPCGRSAWPFPARGQGALQHSSANNTQPSVEIAKYPALTHPTWGVFPLELCAHSQHPSRCSRGPKAVSGSCHQRPLRLEHRLRTAERESRPARRLLRLMKVEGGETPTLCASASSSSSRPSSLSSVSTGGQRFSRS